VELRCTEVSRCSCFFLFKIVARALSECLPSLIDLIFLSPIASHSVGAQQQSWKHFFVFLPHSSCLRAKTVKPHIALFHGSFVCATAEVCCEGCSQQHLVCCFLAAWSACIQYLCPWIAAQCMRCSVVILGDMLHKEQGEDRCFFCTMSMRIVKAFSKTHLA